GVPAVLAADRARVTAGRGIRLGWALLSVTTGAFVAGVLIALGYFLALGTGPPVPSAADVPYLATNVTGVAAILFLAGRDWGASRLRLLLDGGIVACAVLLVSWLTALRAVYLAGGSDVAGFVVGVAYPVSDVASVVIVL